MVKTKEKIEICIRHGETEFSLRSNGSYRCKKCSIDSVTKRRRKVKSMLVEYKGGKCEICGYNKCNRGLEFHHKDPSEKDFGIADKGLTRNIDILKKEVDKCILVCRNCHAEMHDTEQELKDKEYLQEQEKNILKYEGKSFNNIQEKKIENISKESVISLMNEGFTQKEISKKLNIGTTTLTSFNKKHGVKSNQTIENNKREKPSKEELLNLIKTKPFTEIGRMYSVSGNTIRKWCKKCELPYRKKDIFQPKEIKYCKHCGNGLSENTKGDECINCIRKQTITKDELEILSIKYGWNQYDVADELSLSESYIRKLWKKYDLK